jgi:hypothetical protein
VTWERLKCQQISTPGCAPGSVIYFHDGEHSGPHRSFTGKV